MANKKKQDRRIGRTRKLLQDALIQLLKEKPLAKIQIKEIVEVANVSRPSFYQHFETKENLLFSHMDDMFDRIHRNVFEAVDNGEPVEMRSLLTKFYEQWKLNHEALGWVLQVENKDLLIAALRTHASAIKPEFDKHVPPLEASHKHEDYLIDFFTGGMYMLLRRWMDTGMRESPEKMATLTFLLMYNGFSPMRASGRFDDVTM